MTSEKLQASIKRSRWFATALILATFISYFAYFLLIRAPRSNDPATWGQFGDFVGGLLNPIIALFAFYWLTQSIALQLTELSATTSALTDSKNAQERHERHAAKTAKLNAYNSLIASYNADIANIRGNIEFLVSQLPGALDHAIIDSFGHVVKQVDARRQVQELYHGLNATLKKRLEITDAVYGILSADEEAQQTVQPDRREDAAPG